MRPDGIIPCLTSPTIRVPDSRVSQLWGNEQTLTAESTAIFKVEPVSNRCSAHAPVESEAQVVG
jgi:hypothetical protein